ncbi:MAG: hypothetical protein V3S48_03805, partial [Candidatus Neomarinimicrobiota bacterium]
INRAYLTYESEISPALKVKIQSDVGRHKNDSKNTHLFFYLKNAKLDWNNSFGTFTFGLQSTNIFKIQERNWGYRFIEKSAMDLFGLASSADLGIGWYYQMKPGLKGSLLITNGSGYKKPENDKYKLISLRLVTGAEKLQNPGFNAGTILTYTRYDVDSVTVGNKSIIGIFSSLGGNAFRIGGEYDYYNDSENSRDFSIISVYGNFKISEYYEFFIRTDQTTNDMENKKYIIGLNINPAPGFKIAPHLNYTQDKTENSLVYGLNFEFKF